MKKYAVVHVVENVYAISEEKYHNPVLISPYPVYGYIIVQNRGKRVGVTCEHVDREQLSEVLLHQLSKAAIDDFMS